MPGRPDLESHARTADVPSTRPAQASAALDPAFPDVALAPPPDQAAGPDGFVVIRQGGVRIHFLDWGRPSGAEASVLLIPGLLQPAWTWSPVARRLGGVRHAVVADLRGHGLSDAPMDGYDLDSLAADGLAVAEGSGLLDTGPVVVAGHGFGAVVAAAVGARLGERCAGVVLVDGGWERLEVVTGLDVDEFLRGLDEPPEVLRSMDAFLGDRRAFDPATWDADQERAAREAVVETTAGRVVRAVRPHVVDTVVRTMFACDPAAVIAAVEAPVAALVALGAGDPAAIETRLSELSRAAEARVAAGGSAVRVAGFPGSGHNLMRYHPADVAAAILAPAG